MADVDRDTPLRLTAFEHVRRLSETHDHLTATELKPGFVFEGIVRLIRLDPKNLQSRTIRLQVDATRPGRRLGLV